MQGIFSIVALRNIRHKTLVASQVGALHNRHRLYLDFYDLYVANEPASLFYGHRNHHWNAAGPELTANVVAEYLRSEPTLMKR